ncbi:MAG: hypothetical protein HQL77_09325 [Magnetococcales bacterium]|nr:hypothetical protein [Magnetococcales bacterium]
MKRICLISALFRLFVMVVGCLMATQTAWATFDPSNDDTDLFLADPNVTAERPNVLIILDNTANWNQPFTNEKSALVSVVQGLSDSFNLGLMMYPETGNPNDNVDGGYVRFAIRQMTTTNKTVLSTMVNALDKLNDKGNNNTTALSMYEAYLYFSGQASRASYGKIKTDYANNSANNLASSNSLGSYALPASPTSASLYNAPIANGCQKNFIILISNGPANENASALSVSEDKLATLTSSTPPSVISITPNGQQSNWADEWANYLATSDISSSYSGTQSIYTYTVEVDPTTTGQGPSMTALLKSMANKGKGRYYSVSSSNGGQAIINTLNAIFTEIQSVNSVFAATTLPVSVNVRGTNLNQVYVGMFRPDANKLPRWYGNLKCYKLGYDSSTSTLYMVDSNGVKAENSSTGFITQGASSYWTTSSNFWSFRDSSSNGSGGSSDLPDGDLVEKGGVAEKLRTDYASSQTTRKLYSCTGACTSGSALSLYPFDTTNADITSSSLMLDTHTVSSLSALVTQSISALTDVKSVSSLSTAASPVTVSSLTTGSVTKSVSSLTTTKSYSISNLTNSPVTKSITLLTRPSNGTAQATIASHGYSSGQTVTIAGASCNSRYLGTYTITVTGTNTFTYAIANGSASDCSSATATTTSSQVTATVTGHGFSTGTSVTIAGVTPTGFNGTYTITVQDANTFTFTGSVLTSPTVFGTASGQTSTATATTSTAHGFSVGDSITIAGATPTGYNTTVTLLSVPTTTTFTFSSSPLANASGTITATKGSTTVTATTAAAHGFSTGNSITINGASPSDYNGTYTITVTGSTTFTYTTSTALATQTGTSITASKGVSTTATASVTAHGFSTGDSVTISGATPTDYNGAHVITYVDANTFTFSAPTSPSAATGTITARLTSPTAFATLTGHGYSTGNSIIISGATPSTFNGTYSITVLDSNTFKYTLASSPLQAATGSPTAAIASTTAKAYAVSHGFSTGNSVTIAGASPTDFNGTFTVTVTDANNFTYTIPSSQGTASGTITAALATAGSTASARDELINWVRGTDNYEDENLDSSLTDVRASIHSDVLHSKPAVINYNRFSSDNDIVVFYGANDGVFRAIKGGFSADTGQPDPAHEIWGFIPTEFFGNLKRLRNNDPIISSTYKKSYFVDGPIGTYYYDANADGKILLANGDKVYLFLGMRRGGRFLYALDVTTPDAPLLLWKKSYTDSGFTEMGYTWSEPKVVTKTIKTSGVNVSKPVLIFGAGYDPSVEDLSPSTITAVSSTSVTASGSVTNRTMGRGIFVVDATTGAILWQAGPGRDITDSGTHPYLTVSGMNYSIPSDVTVITNNGGSEINRGYVGDTGGTIWRINMADSDVNNWTVTKVAAVADQSTIPGGLRKFLYPPDVVYQTGYDAIMIGSGDREHPLDTNISDRMYMFRDTYTGTSSSNLNITESDLYNATANCIQDSTACCTSAQETAGTCTTGTTSDAASTLLSAAKGWYIALDQGEKVVGNAITLNNAVFFNTNQPSSVASDGSCVNNLGVARAYQVTYTDATAVKDMNSDSKLAASDRKQVHPGGGFLPPPTPVMVQIDGKTLEGVVSGIRVDQPPGVSMGTRLRRFWYKAIE